jgi:hypothetical protein
MPTVRWCTRHTATLLRPAKERDELVSRLTLLPCCARTAGAACRRTRPIFAVRLPRKLDVGEASLRVD